MTGATPDGLPLLIRADANAHMGTGHLMRCMALAQAWQEAGGAAHFLSNVTASLEARLRAEGIGVSRLDVVAGSAADAEQTTTLSREMEVAWVVVDGYQFDAPYQRAIKEAGQRLLFIDDYGHALHYYADLVLNQNIHADCSLYDRREPYTELLLGPQHALLRREFWPWRDWQREIPPLALKILVTLGGSDPDNVTCKVIRALRQLPVAELEARIIVGASNTHLHELEAEIGDSSPKLHLEHNASNMPTLMAWADLAVAAGGSTCLELAFLGLPSLLLVLAENQGGNAAALDKAGAMRNLGWHDDVAEAELASELEHLLRARRVRAEMSCSARQLVDGQGARRVVANMIAGAYLRLRPVRDDDLRVLFEWANDPLARRFSFHPEPIPWEVHQRWFEQIKSNSGVRLLIADLREGKRWTPAGQVRVDADGVISFSLAPRYRGRHLATPILKAAINDNRQRGGRQITAYIKPENTASLKTFSGSGFQCVGWTEVAGQACLKYVYDSSSSTGPAPHSAKAGRAACKTEDNHDSDR